MNNRVGCFFIAFLTTVSSVSAGTFTNAFDAGLPPGTAAYGNALLLPTVAAR